MEEWRTYKIKDICLVNTDQYSAKEGWQTILYLDTGNITENHIGDIQFFSLPSDELPSRARRKVKHNDIIFSTVRPNQRHYGILNHPANNLLVSTGFTVLTAKPGIADPFFVYYYLTQPELIDYLQGVAEQSVSAYPSLKSSDIEEIEIALPPIAEQKRLSSVLRSLDSKIELNIRINHNLEEQADCLISSAIETQSIGSAHLWDICSYVTERVNCDTLNNESYISTENMFANRGGVGIASTIPGGKCTSFKAQDVLVSNIRPYFKKIWRASFSGGCSNDVLCFRTTTGTSSFLYHLLRSDVFFEYVMSGAKGSKMPRGDKQHILNWVIPAFEKGIIASLEGSLEVIDDRVAIIQEENRRLSAIRDSLLPILMNNGIRLNDLTC